MREAKLSYVEFIFGIVCMCMLARDTCDVNVRSNGSGGCFMRERSDVATWGLLDAVTRTKEETAFGLFVFIFVYSLSVCNLALPTN